MVQPCNSVMKHEWILKYRNALGHRIEHVVCTSDPLSSLSSKRQEDRMATCNGEDRHRGTIDFIRNILCVVVRKTCLQLKLYVLTDSTLNRIINCV